jgi:hypothetical protein
VASVAIVLLAALVFGLGIEAQERRMYSRALTLGSASYKLGSTGYTFGWKDGFDRGYELGVARAQAEAKAGRTGRLNEYDAVVDYDRPPEYGTAMAAHLANLRVVRGQTDVHDAAFEKRSH